MLFAALTPYCPKLQLEGYLWPHVVWTPFWNTGIPAALLATLLALMISRSLWTLKSSRALETCQPTFLSEQYALPQVFLGAVFV